MFNFDIFLSAVVILLFFVIGEIVSTKTKAFVPSVFVVAVLFLLGFWSGMIPTEIIDKSGFSSIAILSMLIIVVHMGTMLSIKDLVKNWKTVIIALCSLAGLTGFLMTIGVALFDWNTIIVSVPPLAGGMTAAIIMQNGAAERGLELLSILAIVIYVIQGFVGYPLTSLVLKREGKRLMKAYPDAKAEWMNSKNIVEDSGSEPAKKRLVPPVPKKYRSIYVSLLGAFLTVLLATRLELLTGGVVSKYVFCLVLGVIFAELGILEKNCLNSTLGYGMFVTTAMSMVFAGLSRATPEMIGSIIVPLSGIILIGVAGLFVLSILVGKVLGYTWEMSFAISLNALYGFPPNMILTTEVINSITDDAQAREYLTDNMMPKMLIGGFTSVTVTSTLLAGVFINFFR